MRVVAAPVDDEIGDVAGLAARDSCAAVGNRGARAASRARKRDEGALLGDPDIGVGGVGEQEEVERVRLARCVRRPRKSPASRRTRARAPRCRSASRPPFSRASSGVGSRRPRRARSQTKPTMAEVSESVTQENVTTKRTTIAHSSGVIVPTATTLNIWSAPYAVKAKAPPKTKRRVRIGGLAKRGATSARRSRRENRLNDCAGMASGAKPGIEEPSDEPISPGPGILGRERQAVHR